MVILDFFVNTYLAIATAIGFFFAIWVSLGMIVVPLLVIYLLYKHRKNKDEIIKILKPVIGFIVFVLIAYLLEVV